MKAEYEANLKAADLAVIAKAAKCIHPEVTLSLQEDAIAFWCKDDRKECALSGSLRLEAGGSGGLNIRAKAEQVADLVASLPGKADMAMRVVLHEAKLELEVKQADVSRTANVLEAEEGDLPYLPDYKAVASAVVNLAAFAKVVTSFKRSADVMTVDIKEGAISASYKVRAGNDAWHSPAETKGEGSARYSVALLLAAVKAAKCVGPLARIQISESGPMRLLVKSASGIKVSVYVVSSQAI